MPEVVISGDPHDICRLFYSIWRHGGDDSEAGAEGLIAWQVAAGETVARKAAGAQATANEASAKRAAAGTAEAAPVAEKVALQGDRASRGEINPEGFEVAEATGPQASRGEIGPEGIEVAKAIGPPVELDEGNEVAEKAAPHAEPSKVDDQPSPVGLIKTLEASGTEAANLRIEIGHSLCAKMRSHEFKAKKGGGLEIVEAKHKTGKGQASDMSEIDPEGIEVAKKTAPEAEVHRCPTNTDRTSVRVEHSKPEARPAGLIKTLEASGIEATKGGGWNVKPKHTTDAGTKWFDISPSEGEIDPGDEEWFDTTQGQNTTVALMEASFFDDFRKGEIQEEDLREALEYYAEGRELKGLGPSKIRESDIEEARFKRLAAKGDEIVIEEALEKTQPSQGQGGNASSGNKCAKGAKEQPKGREKGKRGRKG